VNERRTRFAEQETKAERKRGRERERERERDFLSIPKRIHTGGIAR
jgi:hypothetical protein